MSDPPFSTNEDVQEDLLSELLPHDEILFLHSCLDLFQESIASLCDTPIARSFLQSPMHLLLNESSAFHAQLSRQAQHISLPVSKRSVDLLGCLQTMLWDSVSLL